MSFGGKSDAGGKRGFFSTLFAPTDEQAMWRVQGTDDAEAFAQLVARWQDPIYRLCARMIGDAARAEDLTQEIFTKVFVKRKDYRPDAKFSTWLWRIALNHCYDELRRVKRRPESAFEENEETEFECVALTPDAHTVATEEFELVRAGLARIPEISRTVLILRYCEGLKLREISEILELPETTVHSRLAVALSQITKILKPQFRYETPYR